MSPQKYKKKGYLFRSFDLNNDAYGITRCKGQPFEADAEGVFIGLAHILILA